MFEVNEETNKQSRSFALFNGFRRSKRKKLASEETVPTAFGAVTTNVEVDGTLTRSVSNGAKSTQRNLPEVLTSDWNEVGFEMTANTNDDILY